MSGMTRRLAMKFLGGSIAALPSAKTVAPDLLARVSAVAPLASADSVGAFVKSQAVARFGKLLGHQIDDWQSDANTEEYARSLLRTNGLDPDIAAMKSWSPTYRAHKQTRRNDELRAFLRAMDKLVWR